MDVGLFMLNFLNNYKLENKFFIEAGLMMMLWLEILYF
jgi:hypothetical protein